MAHPFVKILEKALSKTTEEDNQLLFAARGLIEKGYRAGEVLGVLAHMEKGRIDDTESAYIRDVREEIEEETGS